MKKHRGPILFLLLIIVIIIEAWVGIPLAAKKKEEILQSKAEKNNIYDIRVISQTGFTEEELEKAKKIEGVKDVEAIREAILNVEDIHEFLFKIKAYTLPESINVPIPEEGKFPDKQDECVIKKGNTSLNIGDIIYLQGKNGDRKSFMITGSVSFPFDIEENEMANTIYFHKDASLDIAKEVCYITAESKEISAVSSQMESMFLQSREEYAQNKRNEIQIRLDEAKAAASAAEKALENLSDDEKDSLLAKQKALGKIELKIDQDEANRYDASQIASRRKELELQKQNIAEKLGRLNEKYDLLKTEKEGAKKTVEIIQNELENIKDQPIEVFTKENNSSHILYMKREEEKANAVYLFLFILILFTWMIGSGLINTYLAGKTLLLSMSITIFLLINAFHYHQLRLYGEKLAISICLIGSIFIFYIGMQAKMKLRIKELTMRRKAKKYPKKIVMHVLSENNLTFVLAAVSAVLVSIGITYIFTPLRNVFWGNYIIAIGIALLLELAVNLKIYYNLKKLS